MQITIREPGSAITHFIAMELTMIAAFPLLMKAAGQGVIYTVSMLIFVMSMILLYGASTTYHSINFSEKVIRVFRKIDHAMIYVLIAGSYTPVCLLILDHKQGYPLLAAVWILAVAGVCMKCLWITCPKWVSSLVYIGMGWVCLFVFGPIVNSLTKAAFLWLLTGGVIYTVGGVIYALKLPIFNSRHKNFGSHEIFHLFVMGGSICHFIFMYQYVACA
ncbi:MAG: hemolysin III family protein [Acetatifactor sp.]|nr:hemolysin III family protein [Acetatifactor sp.]